MSQVIETLYSKEGLYTFFEEKNIIMPKPDTIKLKSLVTWFVREDAM